MVENKSIYFKHKGKKITLDVETLGFFGDGLEKIHKALGGHIKKDVLETEIPISDLTQAGEMVKEKIKSLNLQ